MYELHSRAKEYGTRPSELIGIDGVPAFYFDRAARGFAIRVDNAVQQQQNSSKNPVISRSNALRKFEEMMGADMSRSTVGFASPSVPDKSSDDDDELLVGDH